MPSGILRPQLYRRLELLFRLRKIAAANQFRITQGNVSLCQRVVQLEGFSRGGFRFRECFVRRQCCIRHRPQQEITVRQPGISRRVRGIQVDRFLKVRDGLVETLRRPPVPEQSPPKISLVSVVVHFLIRTLIVRQQRHDLRGDVARDLDFDRDNIFRILQTALVNVAPVSTLVLGQNQLCGNCNSGAGSLHRSFQ